MKKTTRKQHTRKLKNGHRVQIKKHIVTIHDKKGKKKKHNVYITKKPTYAIMDPKTGHFMGSVPLKNK